jgi:hypothetical protein
MLIFAVAIASCSAREPEGPPPRRAFYYWRTQFKLSPVEQRALDDLHIDRLYVRMFDVENGADGPSLIGKIASTDPVPRTLEVVPVVYLKNDVFRHPGPDLAQLVWREVEHRAAALGFVPRELQLDCDWTDGTREAYFAFVRALEAEAKLPLSATIRLHQVKYRERTGVPPVARGMLMFYNMGKFSADPDARAIFDSASAEKYLARIRDYPLPLDAALPIWSWTLHLRDDRVDSLMQSTDPDELAALVGGGAPATSGSMTRGDFLERAGDDRYRVTRSAFLHGTLLREGDVLKVEVTGPTETLAAASLLAPELAHDTRTLSLFDLSERNLTRHGTDKLDQVFHAIR